MRLFAEIGRKSYIGAQLGGLNGGVSPLFPHTTRVSRGVRMARSNGGKAKAFFRTTPSGAFDQYLQDIQQLPLIKDPAEERRLARRVQRGDEKAAERLVTANLRFVISYVKKYQGHGLDLSELVAIGNEGLLKAVKKFDPDQCVKCI